MRRRPGSQGKRVLFPRRGGDSEKIAAVVVIPGGWETLSIDAELGSLVLMESIQDTAVRWKEVFCGVASIRLLFPIFGACKARTLYNWLTARHRFTARNQCCASHI